MTLWKRSTATEILALASSNLFVISSTLMAYAGDEAVHKKLDYRIELSTVVKGFDGKTCWVHTRPGAIPPGAPGNPGKQPIVLITLQKLMLTRSDVFFGLHDLRTDNMGQDWVGPREHDTLERRNPKKGIEVVPCDFWPLWHAASGKLLGTGKTFYYTTRDQHHLDRAASEMAYSAYDPAASKWDSWKTLKLPDDPKFENASAGCAQRYDLANGEILLPIYYRRRDQREHRVTVCRCRFDGTTLHFVEHGDELELPPAEKHGDGFSEPSITKFGDRFYMTLRTVKFGYVTTSDDGLHFGPLKKWTFEDGTDLGSYNTQQHWVTHSDGLFLVYTRRGLKNDHVVRHRAPLVIAEVDPKRVVVKQKTERILVPERGTRLGNFGMTDVSPTETWVTTVEWMQPADVVKYGSDNSVYVAKLIWNRPNRVSIVGQKVTKTKNEPNLVGSWSFDEGQGNKASDSSGNGHDGMIHGAQWCEGKKGMALRFDGQDDFVDCGTAARLNLTKAFTIEAWINPENPIHHNLTIVAKGYRYAGNYHLRMGTPWNRSKLMLVSQVWRTHEIPIAFKKWHHVVGVCDGQRVGLFVDGQLVTVRPFVTTLKANDTPMTIGKCIGAPAGSNPKLVPAGEPFKGMIDEVRIYDGVLEKYRLSGTTGREINRRVRTITTRGEWGEYEGFPGVCRLANGDLLAVFYAGRDHMGWPHPDLPRRGRICIMRSMDEAQTWSKPRTLIDGPTGERDPSISQLKDGTVICTYYGTIWYERGRTCDVHTIRSRDNGQTWNEAPAKVPAPWYTDAQRRDVIAKAGPPAKIASNSNPIREEFKAINATTRPVRELSDGTLILPIYGQYGDEPYRCALVRSRDGGKTWGDISMISEEHHHCEPDVIELPDSRLLCVMRPCMCQSYSTDKGRTWSEPTRLLRGEAPSLLLTSNRAILCGHRERPGTRTGVIMSTDFGKTWSLPRMIDFAGGAYPSFVELSDGRILCLHYQEAAGGNIRQAIFTVDRKTKQIRLSQYKRAR